MPAGGAAYLATHLAQLRAGHPNSFTVAAGDLIGGSTFTSGFFHDEPSVETLNAMHLDASSVGNHEFDEGVTELLRMQNGGCHPVDGCFQQDANGTDIPYPGADFQWLAANVVNEQTGNTVLPATWVEKVGNAKIGFIGMTLEGTDTSSLRPASPAGTSRTRSKPATGRRALLNAQGVKAIVVLLHEGGVQTGTYNGCVGISGPIVEIAQKLDPSDRRPDHRAHTPALQLHDQRPATQPRKVVSAFSFGRIITEMNFVINHQTNDMCRGSVTAVNHIVTRTVAQGPVLQASWRNGPPRPTSRERPGRDVTQDITRAFTGTTRDGRRSPRCRTSSPTRSWSPPPRTARRSRS